MAASELAASSKWHHRYDFQQHFRCQNSQAQANKQSNIVKTSLRAVPDGMLIVDDDLDWVSWNDRLFEILELNKELIVIADSPAKAT